MEISFLKNESTKFIYGTYPNATTSFNDIACKRVSSAYTLVGDSTAKAALQLPGAPTGAENWGILITINPQRTNYPTWRTTQFYVTAHTPANGIYARVCGLEDKWIQIKGTTVEPMS